jgi:hypothetical protein
VFRYDAPPRVETWTLRQAAGEAQIVVETPGGAPVITTYLGTATPSADALVIEVTTATARLALTCKPATRPRHGFAQDPVTLELDVVVPAGTIDVPNDVAGAIQRGHPGGSACARSSTWTRPRSVGGHGASHLVPSSRERRARRRRPRGQERINPAAGAGP